MGKGHKTGISEEIGVTDWTCASRARQSGLGQALIDEAFASDFKIHDTVKNCDCSGVIDGERVELA